MPPRSRLSLLVLGIAGLLAGCGGGGGTPTSTSTSTPAPAPAPEGVTVNVVDGDTRVPLPGATVTPFDAGGNPLPPAVATDAAGTATIPPGATLVQAISPPRETDARSLAPGRTVLTIPLYDPALQSPEYGGGPLRTRYVPTVNLPPPSGEATWTWKSRGLLEFTPAVARGVVALTTGTARIAVLDARDGRTIWTKRQSTAAPMAASPAIITTEDTLLVAGMNGRLNAYGLSNGNAKWEFSTGNSKIESSPLVSDGTVYIGAHNGLLYAVTTDKGTLRWKFQARSDIKGSVAKSGNSIIFGDYSGTIYAVNATTSKQIWRQTIGKRLYGGPAISGNTAVIGDVGGQVVAVDIRNGRVRWRHPTGGAPVYSSPAIARGTVFIGSYNGRFQALDLDDGDVLWTHDAGGRISGSATVVGNVVYTSVLARPGAPKRTFGLDVRSGKVRWQNSDGRYSPAVGAGRTLYIVGVNTLYAYRAP